MASSNPFTSAQAPLAMQMIAPDLTAQQSQLTRQQQLADLLRSQAFAPNQGTQVINGWAVKQQPIEGISKVLQAGLSGFMQRQNDEKQLDLAKALSGRMGQAFDQMAGGGSMPAAAPSSGAMPAAQPDASGGMSTEGGQMPGSAAMPPQTMPSPNGQISQIRNQARAAYMMGNTDLANKLLENISTLTTDQRNMIAMGQDPMLMGQLGVAEARKKGMLEMQPGTTTVDLATGRERFQPKVGEGINIQNGVASAVPGYAGANAEISGANAGAVAGAQAQHDMITVDTPNGPVMMTKAQAGQLAGGGSPNVPDGLDLSRLTPQQQAALAQKDPTAFANGVQSFNQTSQPKTPGIQLQDQGSTAFDKEINSKGAQNILDSRDRARSANDELSSIYESRDAIKKGVYQGFGADFKTDAAKIADGFGIKFDGDKASNTDYLRSTLGKGMMDNAKKLGVNPTDADAKRLDVIIGTIGKDPQAMSKLLDWREQQAGKVIDQHNKDIDSATKTGAKFPFDLRVNRLAAPVPANTAAPKVLKYNPATGGFD